MNYNKRELIEKLKIIGELWKQTLAIKNRMNTFVPEDNYERKITVPTFPGTYKSEKERQALASKCDHTSPKAVELMRALHTQAYAPKKPQKPDIKEFKAPDATHEENDKATKYGCMSIIGAVIAIFFALGCLSILTQPDVISTIPVAIVLSVIGVLVYLFAKYKTNSIKATQKKRTADALAEYNRNKEAAIANYNANMSKYEADTKAYEEARESFLNKYLEWRKIYIEHLNEEKEIRAKLEEDRLAGVAQIEADEFNPTVLALVKTNDILANEYLSSIDTLIDLLEGGRADDLKEALNVYEEMLYRERQLKLQREQEEQRQYEERCRREDEERRHREEMNFLESQERQRRQEEQQRQRDAERRHREEMDQRAQQERNRQYEEKKRADEERRRSEKAELARKQDEARQMSRQCNTCALNSHCSMAFQRPNCASYRPR